jgi:hypothetical protein
MSSEFFGVYSDELTCLNVYKIPISPCFSVLYLNSSINIFIFVFLNRHIYWLVSVDLSCELESGQNGTLLYSRVAYLQPPWDSALASHQLRGSSIQRPLSSQLQTDRLHRPRGRRAVAVANTTLALSEPN